MSTNRNDVPLWVQETAEKYQRRADGRMPSGGHDVLRLCETVGRLTALIRDMQCVFPEGEQNRIESSLRRICGAF